MLKGKSPITKFKYAMKVKKLEEAFSIGASVSEACMYADIHRDTYYRWIRNNPLLQDRFQALLEKPILKARQTVVNAIGSNPELALKFLERKRKAEFSTRNEITGEDGKPMTNEIKITFQDFSDESKSE